MAPNFLDLATNLEYLGAKCLLKRKVNFVPWLMLTGRLFQSRGAATMKDRSPMVPFVRRFGMRRRIPYLFRRKS